MAGLKFELADEGCIMDDPRSVLACILRSRLLFEGKDPKEAVSNLMLRDSNTENSLIPWPGQRN